MHDLVSNVACLCTHNAARSILAETLLNHLGKAVSGRSPPAAKGGLGPKPLALKVLADSGIPTDGLRSKTWDEFAVPGTPEMDLVITVCDQAAGESCPVRPGQPR